MLGFAAAWGAFPVLTAYVAQTSRLSVGAVLAALCRLCPLAAQRRLSTPARLVRRRAARVEGHMMLQPTARCVPIDGPNPAGPARGRPCGPCRGRVVLLAASLAVAVARLSCG